MADTIMTLAIALGLDSTNFDKAIKDSKYNAIRTAEQIGVAFQKMGKTMMVAGGAAVVGITAAFGMAAKAADDMEELGTKVGMTTDQLQEWKFIGGQVGVSLDTITNSTKFLSRNMVAAKDPTSAMGEAFASLGVSVMDANGSLRDSSKIQKEVFLALGKMENETEQNALAMQLMGRSGMELNNIIRLTTEEWAALSEQAKATIISPEAIASLAEFNDKLDETKGMLTKTGSEMLASLAPMFMSIMTKVQELITWFDALPQPVKDFAVQFVLVGGVILTILGSIIWVVGTLLGSLTSILAFFSTPVIATAVAGIGTAFTGMVGGAGAAIATLGTILSGPIGWILAIIAAVVLLRLAWDNNWFGMRDTIIAWSASLGETWNQLIAILTFAWNAAWQAIADAIAASWEVITAKAAEIVQGVMDVFDIDWAQLGKDIITGIGNGIMSMWGWVVTTSENIANAIRGAFSGVFDMGSPSKLMYEYGENIMHGLGQGILATRWVPVEAIRAVAVEMVISMDEITGVAKSLEEAVMPTIENGKDISTGVAANVNKTPGIQVEGVTNASTANNYGVTVEPLYPILVEIAGILKSQPLQNKVAFAEAVAQIM